VYVIVADDSEAIRGKLKDLLLSRVEAIEVSETASVEETLDLLESEQADYLILDLQFPDGSGFEVLERLARTGESDSGGRLD